MYKKLLPLVLVANSLCFASHVQPACAADAPTVLNGEITRTEIKHEEGAIGSVGPAIEGRTGPAIIIINGKTGLNGLSGLSGLNDLIDQFHITRLSTQQYREMKYGVIGIMVQQSLNEHLPVIIDLLPECPAALAGLQKGDELIEANGHQFKPGEGQLEFMRIIGGDAGTNVDITVGRDDKKIHYHLVRMNVEDIADDRVRLRYENILTLMKRSKVDGADSTNLVH
jgi:hypothetical protein